MSEPMFLQVLGKETPEVYSAQRGLFKALEEGSGLDAKTFQLVYLGINAAYGQTGSVAAHAGLAKKAGATREEVRGAVLVTLITSGARGLAACLEAALDSYDNS